MAMKSQEWITQIRIDVNTNNEIPDLKDVKNNPDSDDRMIIRITILVWIEYHVKMMTMMVTFIMMWEFMVAHDSDDNDNDDDNDDKIYGDHDK